MSTMRIALIVEATAGGVARHVTDLVSRLDPAQFTCLLYLSFQRPESRREPFLALKERGVVIREVPMARVPNARAVQQLGDWLQRDAIDLVHLHSAKAGYLGRQAAGALGIPAIYTPHAFPFQRLTDWRCPLYRHLERRLARQTDTIVCVSSGEAEEGLLAGLPEEKLVIIPNGLDMHRWPLLTPAERSEARAYWGFADNEVIVGAMARLTPQKGIDLLLVAAAELLAEFRGARVAIWGEGPQRRMLQRRARAAGLRRVTFLGEAPNPQQAYAAMDAFCTPSRWEAGPYAVLEAMACGLPIVASDVAGNADYLEHDVTGLLVPAELPGPLTGALHTLLIDPDRREGLGEAARRHVEHYYTLERMVAATAALYRRVATRGVIPLALAAPPPATGDEEQAQHAG